jgi:hypothetical protein
MPVDYRDRARGFALDGVLLDRAALACVVNGYPVIFYDSGLYLYTAVDRLTAPAARPLIYGWFIFLTSFNLSPWLVVLAQAAIALWVMRKVIQVVDPACSRVVAAACILARGRVDLRPYFVGQIMADFFSGILPLAIFPARRGRQRIEPSRALCRLPADRVRHRQPHVAYRHRGGVHRGLGGDPRVPEARGERQRRRATRERRRRPRRAALGLAGGVVAATNYLTFGRWELTPAAHVFLMGRLLADGPAARHLQRACPEAGYQLCDHLDELPHTHTQYIWTGPLLDETGGWLGSREESWTIIRRSVVEEPRTVLSNALRAAARQLVTNGIWQDLPPMSWTHPATRRLSELYPEKSSSSRARCSSRGASSGGRSAEIPVSCA